jgi:predicted nucleotidyltransferase component of viral defense system
VLTYEKIREIYAQKGILEIVVEKDYILDWILWGISQDEDLRSKLVFKGGTALHKMYFPDWRFSEDLDFTTTQQIKENELNDAIGKLCENVKKRSGINLRQKEINAAGNQDLEWSFEVKIEYVGPRGQTGGNLPLILLHITNDEVLMDEPETKMVIFPCDDLPADFAILTYSLEEILAEKIRTVLHQRCWPRDIYDTWRLLREVKNFIAIKKVVDIYSRKALYRGFNPEIPHDIDERILRIKRQWKDGLQRQINAPPDFDKVYPDIKNLLEKVLKDYNVIKGGFKMLETRYVIKYRKNDLEIEVQGDKAFVEEKFKELFELNPFEIRRENDIASPALSQSEGRRQVSLAEFLKSKNPKSHGDKILVFGYYLEKVMGESSFNMDDIEKCYIQARISKTKNFPQYIAQLIRDGSLMEAEEKKDNKKAWILTDSGLKYVENLAIESK